MSKKQDIKKQEQAAEPADKKKIPRVEAVKKDEDILIEENAQSQGTGKDINNKEEKKDKKNKEAKSGKLCKLVKQEYLDKHIKEYGQLVADPKFVCLKCGRAARDKKALCKPVKIG